MMRLCLLVGAACAVPLEQTSVGGLGVDFSEMEFSDEMYTSTNATRRGLMQKQFLDHLDTIDFSREMQTPSNATKRDLVQKKWWKNLKAQVQSLIDANNVLNNQLMEKVSAVTSLSSQIREIHEVYNELTTCAAEIPGVEDPWKSIHSLAVAYKEQGYPGVANYVESHLEIFVREASNAMDFKKPVTLLMTALDSAKDISLIKDGQLDETAVADITRVGLGVVENTLDMIPSYTCFKESLFEGMDTGASLDKLVGMVVRMAKEVCCARVHHHATHPCHPPTPCAAALVPDDSRPRVPLGLSSPSSPSGDAHTSKPHALTPPPRVTQIFARIEEMWQSVMGPDGLVGQSLNSMKAQFESSVPILLEPIFGGIDDIMSGAVDLSCEFGNKMLTAMTDVVQKNAIFLPGYCWAKDQVQNMLDNPVMAMGILFNAVSHAPAIHPHMAKSAAARTPRAPGRASSHAKTLADAPHPRRL
jgi:hypothetical protein